MKKFSKVIAVASAMVLLVVGFAACGTKNSQKVYKICSDTSFKPFEYLDTNTNEYVGIDMDILAAIAEDQGFKYEMNNVGFDAACGNVQSGQADAMIAGMTINDERKLIYDFSEPYFYDGQIMCVAADSTYTKPSDLAGTVVAAKNGTMGSKFAEANKDACGFTIQYYEDSPTMYQAIANGINSACFEDYTVAGAAFKSNPDLGLKTVGDVINSAPYGFAVCKGKYPELISMFNEGLKNIKENGKYDAILAKYGIETKNIV